MDAYATVAELERSWRALTDAEQARAGDLLLRASGFMAAEMAARGVSPDTSDDTTALNLSTVCCNIVRRSMSSGGDGIASMSQTAGSSSASVTWSNPDGAFYLTKAELRMLGAADGGRIGWAPIGRAGWEA